MNFQPDHSNILKVLNNQRPDYLPLYEHHIDARHSNEDQIAPSWFGSNSIQNR